MVGTHQVTRPFVGGREFQHQSLGTVGLAEPNTIWLLVDAAASGEHPTNSIEVTPVSSRTSRILGLNPKCCHNYAFY